MTDIMRGPSGKEDLFGQSRWFFFILNGNNNRIWFNYEIWFQFSNLYITHPYKKYHMCKSNNVYRWSSIALSLYSFYTNFFIMNIYMFLWNIFKHSIVWWKNMTMNWIMISIHPSIYLFRLFHSVSITNTTLFSSAYDESTTIVTQRYQTVKNLFWVKFLQKMYFWYKSLHKFKRLGIPK